MKEEMPTTTKYQPTVDDVVEIVNELSQHHLEDTASQRAHSPFTIVGIGSALARSRNLLAGITTGDYRTWTVLNQILLKQRLDEAVKENRIQHVFGSDLISLGVFVPRYLEKNWFYASHDLVQCILREHEERIDKGFLQTLEFKVREAVLAKHDDEVAALTAIARERYKARKQEINGVNARNEILAALPQAIDEYYEVRAADIRQAYYETRRRARR